MTDVPREERIKRGRQIFDASPEKPPYRVPGMAEIAAIPWNGLTVATTFAGAGGSSLGYRMAGFRVVWANEFLESAQESYRANMADGTILDCRDVRDVTADEILAAAGLRAGELDLFDGSPPCQAFSTAGKRERGWGEARRYANGAEQKNEEMFWEFIRLRDGLMPRAFVAENVAGLVKGAAKGYFIEILRRLKVGYRVEARVVDAQWLGVPQQRQRVTFVGVREDLGLAPAFPSPQPWRYSVREALPWLDRVVEEPHGHFGGLDMDAGDGPAPTIVAGSPGQQQKAVVLKNSSSAFSHKRSRFEADEVAPAVMARRPNLNVGIEHNSHAHVVVRRIDRDDVVGDNVAPSIEGYAIGREYDRLNPGQASDKYVNLVRPDPSKPCPTITAYGAGSSGTGVGNTASVCHPTEKRKFTILEVKRLCSFPDDFILAGPFSQQWERLGNSVPPLMARAIAEAVRDKVLLPARAADKKISRNHGRAAATHPTVRPGRSRPAEEGACESRGTGRTRSTSTSAGGSRRGACGSASRPRGSRPRST